MKKLSIIKIGGNILDDDKRRLAFIQQIANMNQPVILVHGGGKSASRISEQLQLQPVFEHGRRITPRPQLDVAVMVYAGLINKQVVAEMQQAGLNAIGMCGADGNTILSERRNPHPVDFGFVGDVTYVNAELIHQFITLNLTPVFCAITYDRTGQLLNTNADTIASQIAVALHNYYATELFYCFEKKGVLSDVNNEDSVIDNINPRHYALLKNKGAIAAGMIPKLDNCFSALKQHVSKVWIGDETTLLSGNNQGTSVTLE